MPATISAGGLTKRLAEMAMAREVLPHTPVILKAGGLEWVIGAAELDQQGRLVLHAIDSATLP